MVISKGWVIAVLIYTLFLYITLPFMPQVWSWLLPIMGPHVTRLFILMGLLMVIGLGMMARMVHVQRLRRCLMGLGLVVICYVVLLKTLYFGGAPAQKAHLMVYGVLAYLALNAFRGRGPFAIQLGIGLGYVILVAVVDEYIQGILPMRHFSWKDMLGNCLGASLGFLAWVSASPFSPWLTRIIHEK